MYVAHVADSKAKLIFRSITKLQEFQTNAETTQYDRASHWKYNICIKMLKNKTKLYYFTGGIIESLLSFSMVRLFD